MSNHTVPEILEALTVPEILEAGAATFRERNATYKDTYKNAGPALLALFAGRIPEIVTQEDATRFTLINHCLGKLMRYCASFENGGHIDSARDLAVYAAMLESLTEISE